MHRFLPILLCFQLHGQAPLSYNYGQLDSLIGIRPDWKQLEASASDDLRERFLEYIFHRKEEDIYFFGSETTEDSSSFSDFSAYHDQQVHVMDLDRNGYLDIVYDGRTSPGFESGEVLLFLTMQLENPEFLLQNRYSGTVLGVDRTNGTELLILTYPCCVEYAHKLTRILVSTATSYQGSTFPVSLETGSLGLVFSDPETTGTRTDLSSSEAGWISESATRLLVAPHKNDLTEDVRHYEDDYTPVIALLPEKTTVNIVSEFTDDTGFSWCFVILENREELPENIFREDVLFPVPQTISGWVAAEKIMIR